jgi:hypothetical protein
MSSASYTLFLELGKVIGATRMMELCELYIARNKPQEPTVRSFADASGARFWRDCSDANPFVAVYPPAWNLETPITAAAASGIPGLPPAPKKAKQAFQSPLLSATPPPESPNEVELVTGHRATWSPARRLSFTSLDGEPIGSEMPPLESYATALPPLGNPGAALCHTANSRGEYSWYSGLAGLPTASE